MPRSRRRRNRRRRLPPRPDPVAARAAPAGAAGPAVAVAARTRAAEAARAAAVGAPRRAAGADPPAGRVERRLQWCARRHPRHPPARRQPRLRLVDRSAVQLPRPVPLQASIHRRRLTGPRRDAAAERPRVGRDRRRPWSRPRRWRTRRPARAVGGLVGFPEVGLRREPGRPDPHGGRPGRARRWAAQCDLAADTPRPHLPGRGRRGRLRHGRRGGGHHTGEGRTRTRRRRLVHSSRRDSPSAASSAAIAATTPRRRPSPDRRVGWCPTGPASAAGS